jgi:hypothetical protein
MWFFMILGRTPSLLTPGDQNTPVTSNHGVENLAQHHQSVSVVDPISQCSQSNQPVYLIADRT